MRRPVHGGPADGLTVPAGTRVYVWLGPDGKAHPAPEEGAALYVRRQHAYVFCGYQRALCQGCGAIVMLVTDHCPLCGSLVP